MEITVYNISQVLGIAILHSLWQGLLVYFVLRIVFALFSSLSSAKKYNLAVCAMAMMALFFSYTLYARVNNYHWVSIKAEQASTIIPYLKLPVNVHYSWSFYNAVAGYLPLICAVYFIGLFINLAKLSWEWTKIRQVKRSLVDAVQMQQFINKFSKKLAISKNIRLKFSELIDVPCVIGYLRPLIILPVSLSVHLSACEIESILLHELSHIKRNDYLINIFQQFITIILFFNPFTQLISRIINRERENGCDDLVVEKTKRPLIYARALLKLEETRKHNLQLALAATGKNFHLLNRIERIMKTEKNISGMRHLLLPALLLAGSISCIAWFNPKTAGNQVNQKKSKPAVIHSIPATANFVAANPDLTKGEKQNIVDSASYHPFADTNKHPRKVIITKEQDTTKKVDLNYDDNADGPDSLVQFRQNADWAQQAEFFRKQGELMRKQFSSPEWKAQMKAMAKQGEEMRKQFNSPAWKNQIEALRKHTLAMTKHIKGTDWKNQMDIIRKQSEELKKQFEKPEWKNQLLAMEKQSEELKKHINSDEWKQQEEVVRKQGEEMQKQFNILNGSNR